MLLLVKDQINTSKPATNGQLLESKPQPN